VTKRALWREYLQVVWHTHAMTWPEFLTRTISDRLCQLDELNALIDRHNREATKPPED